MDKKTLQNGINPNGEKQEDAEAALLKSFQSKCHIQIKQLELGRWFGPFVYTFFINFKNKTIENSMIHTNRDFGTFWWMHWMQK